MPVTGRKMIAFADWCSAGVAAVCYWFAVHLCYFEVVGGVSKVVFELRGQAVNLAGSVGRCDRETNHSFFPFGRYEAVRKKLRTCLIQIGLEWCRPCDKFTQPEEGGQCKHDEACQTEAIHNLIPYHASSLEKGMLTASQSTVQ